MPTTARSGRRPSAVLFAAIATMLLSPPILLSMLALESAGSAPPFPSPQPAPAVPADRPIP